MSDEKVVKLSVVNVGDGRHIEVDNVLDGAKDSGLVSVVVVGVDKDGRVHCFSSDGTAESVVLLERGKHFYLF